MVPGGEVVEGGEEWSGVVCSRRGPLSHRVGRVGCGTPAAAGGLWRGLH